MNRNQRAVFLTRLGFATTAIFASSVRTVNADTTVVVRFSKQLFVDDYLVSQKAGVKHVLQTVKKENGGQPTHFWNVDPKRQQTPLKAWIYATPYYDDVRQVFRMWSRVYQSSDPQRADAQKRVP